MLAGGDAEMAQESPRERLFDVLMRRIELLEPHKAAVRSLSRSCRRDPGASSCSQQPCRTLTRMDAHRSGYRCGRTRGMVRAQGLALLYASVLRVWVHDDDPGQARTMAALDRALARGTALVRLPRRSLPHPETGRMRRRRRRDADDTDEAPIKADRLMSTPEPAPLLAILRAGCRTARCRRHGSARCRAQSQGPSPVPPSS